MFKKKWPTMIFVVCVVAMGYGADIPSAPAEGNIRSISIITEKPYSRRYQPLINAVVKEMGNLEIPGAAVAVVEGGETTFAAGFGSKHPHRPNPVKP